MAAAIQQARDGGGIPGMQSGGGLPGSILRDQGQIPIGMSPAMRLGLMGLGIKNEDIAHMAAAVQPQYSQDPEGNIFAIMPNGRTHLIGKGPAPMESIKVGGVDIPTYNKQVSPGVWRKVPYPLGAGGSTSSTGTPGGGPTASGYGDFPGMPQNGDINSLIKWGKDLDTYKKASETQSESNIKYSDRLYQGLMGTGMIAAQQKMNLGLLHDIVNDPKFTSGLLQNWSLEQRRALAFAGINPDAAAPMEVMRQLTARMVADQFAGIRSLAAETGESGGRIFQSMLDMEEAAMPSPKDTPSGIIAKVNILDKVGDLMMQFAQAAAEYKAANGRLDPGFEVRLQDTIAKSKVPWGAVKASPYKETNEKPTGRYDPATKQIVPIEAPK